MNASLEQSVFESDCHLALEFGTTRMTCYMAIQLLLLGSLTPSQMSVCARACVCAWVRACVRYWSEFTDATAVHTKRLYDKQCQNVGLTNLWGVSHPISTTQYSLISITLCPKCFGHTQANPKTEPLFVQCNLWHFIKAGGKSKYH